MPYKMKKEGKRIRSEQTVLGEPGYYVNSPKKLK